eukprot:GCRY01006309.1.p2 GENE.GCRY01006309.1~~GCRY01006309.1.p2  ORF type:complete len:136 (+),score=18.51 GCRY01006309.1:415-822(+)
MNLKLFMHLRLRMEQKKEKRSLSTINLLPTSICSKKVDFSRLYCSESENRACFLVLALNPFEELHGKRMEAWEKVAQNSGVFIGGPSTKNRIENLIRARRKDEMQNLKKSGTEEQYAEREMLLDEVIEMIKETKV